MFNAEYSAAARINESFTYLFSTGTDIINAISFFSSNFLLQQHQIPLLATYYLIKVRNYLYKFFEISLEV